MLCTLGLAIALILAEPRLSRQDSSHGMTRKVTSDVHAPAGQQHAYPDIANQGTLESLRQDHATGNVENDEDLRRVRATHLTRLSWPRAECFQSLGK